ncbi:C45 family autoproteolytic acyltransferase/hydolase [Bacillus pseudomycoides]|uniref:C45 family autoproteolytic acyltransferase/hydolase n=1 Tax=Bacillus pseudomycoides TaxID=64104 RepID=UPI000BECD02A|nr:C45 family peptidase [Bacillus pseudomycoides]PEE40839.1 choloylglycine hydrolase [Bacillus pseudomycoides]PEI92949.1 choloylglycine hydrolase [Bacillus pseudomycoides]PGA90971.1 choloylglycine hydrolase [Bacillus pseudomycoides]PHF47054.1 choloylglycine hydrolase [Bacillus pseudomycoides]
MYHPRLRGTHYEMGKHYANILYKNGFRFPKVSEEKLAFGKQSHVLLKDFYPEFIEEMKGFAEGCHVTYEEVSSFILSIGVFEPEAQCSIFALYNGSEVIMGRNYDLILDLKKYTESSLVCPEDKHWYVGHSDVFLGKVDGMNEQGLAVAITLVQSEYKEVGLNFYVAVRKILENASTTEEAIHILREFPSSICNNYLLVDQLGDMAVVEKTPNNMFVRRPREDEDFIVCTNHFVSKEMKALQQNIDNDWSKSQDRYTYMEEQLRKNSQLNRESAQDILSNSKEHVCLNLKKYNFGTLYSVVYELNSLRIHRAEGQPNRCKYKEDKRLIEEIHKKRRGI